MVAVGAGGEGLGEGAGDGSGTREGTTDCPGLGITALALGLTDGRETSLGVAVGSLDREGDIV